MQSKSILYSVKFHRSFPINSPSRSTTISSFGHTLEISILCKNCEKDINFTLKNLQETPKINAFVSRSLNEKYIDVDTLKRIAYLCLDPF